MTRRTSFGATVQVAQLLGIPLPEAFTKASTLNTILNINPDAMPNGNELPRLRYFMMGIGALAYREGVGGIAIPQTKPHTSKHANLFRSLPCVVREVGNDLEESFRARYCLREIKNFNGTDYIVYNARRFSVENTPITVSDQVIVNGRVESSAPFIAGPNERNPVPTENSSVITNPLEAQVQRVSAVITLAMDAFDVSEALNAARIIYGSEDYSHISELGVFTGIDRSMTSSNGAGGNITLNEVVCAQIHTHVPAQLALTDRRTGFELRYDVAANEALYVNGG